MRVTCPKCSVEIEVSVSSLYPKLRWGTNQLSEAAAVCVDLRDGKATLPMLGMLSCHTLDLAVERAAIGDRV